MRTRRVLLLYIVNGDYALLVLNGAWLNSDNALLVLNRRYFEGENNYYRTKVTISIAPSFHILFPQPDLSE